MHIHENFRNYGVLETVVVKFVHYCYHSSNWNLGDFSNQDCMFTSMGYDWAFGNCLKHWLVHGSIPRWIKKLFRYVVFLHVMSILTRGIFYISPRLRDITRGKFLGKYTSRQSSSPIIFSFDHHKIHSIETWIL